LQGRLRGSGCKEPEELARLLVLAPASPATEAAAAVAAAAAALLVGIVAGASAGASSAAAFTDIEWLQIPRSDIQRLSSRTTSLAESSAEGAELPAAAPAGSRLPYPVIRDQTEGIAAFGDVLPLLPPPRSGRSELLLLDVGGGRSNAGKRFLEASVPRVRVEAVDPYNRSEAENLAAEKVVEEADGADVVTSMSVLNVVQEKSSRTEHLSFLRRAVRPGGLVIIKVWAGLWPQRGTGEPTVDEARGSYQANAWASSFLPEVEDAFGKGWAYADNNLNMIVAVRAR